MKLKLVCFIANLPHTHTFRGLTFESTYLGRCPLNAALSYGLIQVEYSCTLIIRLANHFAASSLPKSFDGTAPHGELSKNSSKNNAQGWSLAFKDTFALCNQQKNC